jgi:hypothetical protein
MVQRILGLVLVGSAVFLAVNTVVSRREAVVVQGTVVAIEHRFSVDEDGFSLLHRPVVEYRAQRDGPPIRVRPDVWVGALRVRKGDTIALRHPPGDPRAARVDSLLDDVLLPVVLLILGVVGLAGRLTVRMQRPRIGHRWED